MHAVGEAPGQKEVFGCTFSRKWVEHVGVELVGAGQAGSQHPNRHNLPDTAESIDARVQAYESGRAEHNGAFFEAMQATPAEMQRFFVLGTLTLGGTYPGTYLSRDGARDLDLISAPTQVAAAGG